MAFGPAKGLNYEEFCKAVKTITFVIIRGTEAVAKVDLPLQHYNVPISNYQVEEE